MSDHDTPAGSTPDPDDRRDGDGRPDDRPADAHGFGSQLTPGDRALLAALRSLEPEDGQLLEPPRELWSDIEDELTDELTHPVFGTPRPHLAGATADPPRRRRRMWVVGAAAAVAAVVGAGVGITLVDGDDGPSDQVVAATELTSDGLDGAPLGLVGTATVEQDGSHQVLRVDIGAVGPGSGRYLELWLIRTDISGMVSLGTVRADGTYQLPNGLQIDEYPIVDVSTEAYDGDPAHSGRSLLRGSLS